MRHKLRSFRERVRFRLTQKLPATSPLEIFPELRHTEVRLKAYSNRFANVSWQELIILCSVARARNVKRLFEFGTFDGLTTWHLLANTSEISRITTIDLPLDHPVRSSTIHDRSVGKIHGCKVGEWFIDTPFSDRVEQLLQDSLQFDPTPYTNQIDYCFIDASHEYFHVKTDTENAFEMVRPGGVIFWHDYSKWWRGVQRLLDELNVDKPIFRLGSTSLACHIVVKK